MSRSDTVERELPLKPVDFHILLVLTGGDLHGYGMVSEIEERSAGRIRLEPGNLYRHIRRLVDAGMVEPVARRVVEADTGPTPTRAERRRYYRVTPFGRAVLTAEAGRMRSLAAAVESRLGPEEGGA